MKLLLALATVCFLWANEEQNFVNATLTNEPSTVIDNCVSAITGAYFISETDCHLHAQQPYSLNRMYISSEQIGKQPRWELFPHLRVTHEGDDTYIIKEPTGAIVHYKKSKPIIGEGFSNSGPGSTTIANNRLKIKKSGLILYTANGTARHYTFKHINQDTLLTKERLPNGNWIHYEYSNSVNPHRIHIRSPTGTLRYLSIDFEYINWNQKDAKILVHKIHHDKTRQLILEYQYNRHKRNDKKYFHLATVNSYQKPPETIQYTQYGAGSTYFAHLRDFAEGRFTEVAYYHTAKHQSVPHALKELDENLNRKVHSIHMPTQNNEKALTHSLVYTDNKTTVKDPLGNKTIYEYTKEKRLSKILKYRGTLLYYEQEYTWSKDGDLIQKTLLHSNKPYLTTTYTYDKYHNPITETIEGNLTGLGTTDKKTTTYTYDKLHLIEKQAQSGLTTKITYHPNTTLPHTITTLHKDKILREEYYIYNRENILIQHIEQGEGKKITKIITPNKTYPAIGQPASIATYAGDDLLSRTEYTYNNSNLPILETHYDATGTHLYTLHKEYDAQDRLISTTDPLNRKTNITLDTHSNPIQTKSEITAYHTTNTYDHMNRLASTTKHTPEYPDYTDTITYDALSRPTIQTSPQGHQTEIIHSPNTLTTKTTLPSLADNRRPTITTNYDFLNRPTSTTDPESHTTKTTYTALGQPATIIYPDKTRETYTYTINGNLKTHTLQNDTTIIYTYDALGRPLTKKTYAPAANKPLTQETYTYDSYNLLTATNPADTTTHYTYDHAGRQTSQRIHHAVTLTKYNAQSLPHKTTTYTDADEVRIHLTEYNLLAQPIKETETDLTGNTYSATTYIYDTHDNLARKTHHLQEDNLTTSYTYDSLSRLRTTTDPLSQTTTTRYDDLNYQTHFTDLKGRTLTTTTDPHGNRILTEVHQNQTLLTRHAYTYSLSGDQTDLEITVLNPEKTIHRNWIYNCNHQQIHFIDAYNSPTPKTTITTYTPTGQIATLTKSDGTTLSYTYDALDNNIRLTAPGIDYTYTYDTLSRITKATDNLTQKTTTRTYDTYSNIIQETLANNLTIARTYDLISRPKTLTYPDATTTTYTYDPYHLIALTRNAHAIDYTYNQLHQITQSTNQTHTYDRLSRPTTITSPHHTDTIHAYDTTSNPLSRTLNKTPSTHTYDTYDHLLTEPAHTYTYDSLHNRTSHNSDTYTYNTLNQNTAQPHDPNGNTLQTTTPGYIYNTTNTYTYDALDRLITINDIPLTYDPFHRLITYNNLDILYDNHHDIGTYKNNQPLNHRILGPTPLAEIGATALIELGHETYTVHHDILGNIHHLHSPTTTHTYAYSAYGTTHTSPNPWQYQGKRTLGHLVAFGQRIYSPLEGRFLTPDPAGYTDAPNLYHYLLASPLSHHDPWGLWIEPSSPEFWNNFTESAKSNYEERESFKPYLKEQQPLPTYDSDPDIPYLPDRIRNIPYEMRQIISENENFDLYWGKRSGGQNLPIVGTGMCSNKTIAKERSQMISNKMGDIPTIYFATANTNLPRDFLDALMMMMGGQNRISKTLTRVLESAISNNYFLTTFIHSKAGPVFYSAVARANPLVYGNMDVFTFGNPKFFPEKWARNSMNYVSEIDPIPKIAQAIRRDPNSRLRQLILGTPCGINSLEGCNIEILQATTNYPMREHNFDNRTYSDALNRTIQQL